MEFIGSTGLSYPDFFIQTIGKYFTHSSSFTVSLNCLLLFLIANAYELMMGRSFDNHPELCRKELSTNKISKAFH